jgi:hypothetical protein
MRQLTQLVEEETGRNWRDEPITEKLQDVLPLMIALGSYIGKILVQFQCVVWEEKLARIDLRMMSSV